MKPWYQRSMFRNLVDMHIPSGEGYLEQFDPEEYASCMETAGVDTAYVYASNCLGLCLYPTKVGYRHSIAEKRDIFGETIAARVSGTDGSGGSVLPRFYRDLSYDASLCGAKCKCRF